MVVTDTVLSMEIPFSKRLLDLMSIDNRWCKSCVDAFRDYFLTAERRGINHAQGMGFDCSACRAAYDG